jgi:hypothetical protein
VVWNIGPQNAARLLALDSGPQRDKGDQSLRRWLKDHFVPISAQSKRVEKTEPHVTIGDVAIDCDICSC